jgi:hypothetical protein
MKLNGGRHVLYRSSPARPYRLNLIVRLASVIEIIGEEEGGRRKEEGGRRKEIGGTGGATQTPPIP